MATAVGAYATTALVKERLDVDTDHTWTTEQNTLLGKFCDDVNQWLETYTGQVLAPITYTNALFDGWPYPMGSVVRGGKGLRFPHGIRSVSALAVADATGGSFTSATSGDWFYWPGANETSPAMPSRILMLSNLPAGPVNHFPPGYENIKVTGTGGPATIPDDVRSVAVTTVVRAWRARQSGQSDEIATLEADGSVIVSRFVSAEDRNTLKRYMRPLVA